MNILILQGPNLNLLGLKSANINYRLTLDRLNKSIRNSVVKNDVKLKFLQTHKQFQAINFLQRNRNWANGLLFIPTSWAKNEFTILETINLINIKTAVIYFNPKYSFGTPQEESIMVGNNLKSFNGEPTKTCIKGLSFLLP